MIVTAFFAVIWKIVHDLLRESFVFVALFPITGAIYLFLLMPLATAFAFPKDLPKDVNPLIPRDYAFLVKKTWFAMKNNNFKVDGKDL